MTITRRRFTAGLGATAASISLSPLLTYSTQQEVKPAKRDVLYAMDYTGDGVYQLSLNMKHDHHPDFHITAVNLLIASWVDGSRLCWYFVEQSLDDFIDYDWAFEYWLGHNSGSAEAYRFLSDIDLKLANKLFNRTRMDHFG